MFLKTESLIMTSCCILRWSLASVLTVLATATAAAQSQQGPAIDMAQPQRTIDRLQGAQHRTSTPRLTTAFERPAQSGSKPLFKLKSVVLKGGSSLSLVELKQSYRQYINKDVSAADLTNITAALTESYREAGWHLTRAIIHPQNADGGRLVISIIEGRVEEVRVRGNSANKSAVQSVLLPLTHEGLSRRETVERKLLLASDLPGVRIAETSLEEIGTATGRFRLLVDVESWNNYTSIATDNRGTNAVGPYQSYLTTNFNSLFRPGDTLGAAFSSTAPDVDELKYGRFNYSTPIGLDGSRLSFLAGHSSVRPGDFRRDFDTRVRADFAELRATMTPLRTQTSSLWLSAAASAGEYAELDVIGKVYADHLRIVSGTAEYQLKDHTGGWNYLTVNAKVGLPIFGASSEIDPLTSRFGVSGDFAKVEAYYTRIQNLDGPWSLKISAATQLASGPLLVSQQFYLGAAFGRGFFGLDFSRDNAAAGSVELRYDQSLSSDLLKSYQLYSYVDHTSLWNVNSDVGSLRLSLVGLGARIYFPAALQASIEIAKPIEFVTPLNQTMRPRIFFGISKAFKFCPFDSKTSCS